MSLQSEQFTENIASPSLHDQYYKSALVVIPCLNEEQTVGRVIKNIPKNIPGISSIQVLVIDDGSSDETVNRARAAGAEVISHTTNLGLGITFREAVSVALIRGIDVLIHIDGDGQFDPTDIPTLVAPIVKSSAHMATASRFINPELVPKMPLIKYWGNRGLALTVRLLTGKSFHDVSCGFRAFSREAMLRMTLFGRFTYTQETFLDLVVKRLAIIEVPVRVKGTREHGTSRMTSSITRYAVQTLQIMIRAFIAYHPLRFFVAVSFLFLATGLGFLGFLGIHYIETQAFSPHIWAGFVGGSFTLLGVSTLITGFLGDTLLRVLMNQENILYYLKSAAVRQKLSRGEQTHGSVIGNTKDR